MKKNISYYRQQFKDLIKEICKEMDVKCAEVRVSGYWGYYDTLHSGAHCNIKFEENY